MQIAFIGQFLYITVLRTVRQTLPLNKQYQYRFTHYVFNPRSNELYSGDETHTLEQKVTDLLLVFCQHPGEILDKDWLLKKVWPGRIVNEESLSVAISKLRRILHDSRQAPQYIKTITGSGYQWLAEVSEDHLDDPAKPPSRQEVASEVNYRSARHQSLTKKRLIPGLILVLLLTTWGMVKFTSPPSESDNVILSEALSKLARQADKHNQSEDLTQRREAIRLYRQIIEEQPAYLPAYLGIARAKLELSGGESYLDFELYADEVKALVSYVLNKDPENAEAWTLMATIYFLWDWDYDKADDAFRKAIEYAPQAPSSYLPYTEFLLARGQFQQAEHYINKLRAINPSYYQYLNLSFVYLMRNEPEQALAEIKRLKNTESHTAGYNRMLHRLGILLKDENLAFSQLLILFKSHQLPDAQIKKYQEIFQQKGLKGLFAQFLEEKFAENIGHYQPPLAWARYAIVAGQHESATRWLQQAIEQHQAPVLFIGIDPHYLPLRNHPEFKALLQHLPE